MQAHMFEKIHLATYNMRYSWWNAKILLRNYYSLMYSFEASRIRMHKSSFPICNLQFGRREMLDYEITFRDRNCWENSNYQKLQT